MHLITYYLLLPWVVVPFVPPMAPMPWRWQCRSEAKDAISDAVATAAPPTPEAVTIEADYDEVAEEGEEEAQDLSATPMEPVEEEETRIPTEEEFVDEIMDEVRKAQEQPMLNLRPFPCKILGMEMALESRIARKVEGRGDAWLFKSRCVVPGAAIVKAFDMMVAKAQEKNRFAEPGFRPGEIPPWIKTQIVQFSMTSVMEDLVRHCLSVHGLQILEGDDHEDDVKWLENPNDDAKKYILGNNYTFHAAFNATMPPGDSDDDAEGGEVTIDSLCELTPSLHNRAKNLANAGGKLPTFRTRSPSSKAKKKKTSGASKKKRKR